MAEEVAVPASKPRRDHVAAMKAERGFIDNVLADPQVTPSQMRVAMALMRLVTTYSRTTDRISRAQIAKVAGVSEETVKRALKKWHERRWITWEPSTIKGKVSRLTVRAAEEPRVTQGDPTSVEGPRVKKDPEHVEPRVTQSDPLPERKPSGEKAAAPAPESDDDLEGLADSLIAHALPGAGCSWKLWAGYPAHERDRLEQAVDAALRLGTPPGHVFDLLAAPSNVPVLRWPGFLLSRLPGQAVAS